MEIVIQITQFILSLSLLIILHEMGHMLPAKYFKTKVEKFYLFFDAGFSLFKIKKGETEYGIGWIPLGGYVKISGMIDESMDKEQMKEPAKPWEFRSKPAWQRLIIMIGGVTVNVISGILIYIMIAGVWGTDTLMPKDVSKDGYAVSPYFKKYGLKDHDIVLEIDGVKISDARSRNINRHLMVRGVNEIKVLHANGNTELISFPENLEYEILEEGNPFSEWSFPVVADFPSSLDNAKEAGIEIGDSIIQIGDIAVQSLSDLRYYLNKEINNSVRLIVMRDGEKLTIEDVKVNSKGLIGFVSKQVQPKITHLEYGFIESIPEGLSQGYWTIHDYIAQLKFVFTKKGASSMGGFGTIGSLFPPKWNWYGFWQMTALLSMILAVMNLLPIPALDGGHVMFLIYEMFSGKPPSDKFLTGAQVVGMALLFTLLIYANGMDIYRWVTG
tara:strand:+ start:4896 stop:6221 length:1326 start_codon:yes stop_codon:yes gene_type:complete